MFDEVFDHQLVNRQHHKLKYTDGNRWWKTPQSDFPKGIGDVKAAGYDLRPGLRRPGIYRGYGRRGSLGGARSPFILSTPHHSEAFADQGWEPADDAEAHLAEIAQALEAMGHDMAELQEAYEQLLAQLEGPPGGSAGGGS